SGVTVSFSASGSASPSSASPTTDGSGNASFTFTDSTAETVTVSASEPGGGSASIQVAFTVAVSAQVNTGWRMVSGQAVQGQTLTGSQGTWTGSPPPTLTNEWDRCDISGNNCVAIGGQAGLSYVLVLADVGSTIRFKVTGTNLAGSSA